MSKNRLEAFSDGVLAIIITIMVLELKVPHGADWEALRALIPVFGTNVMSFIYVGIYWNNHHHLFHLTRGISGGILWANLHLLFWLSLIPFVTGWMDENHFTPLPTALYGVVLPCCAVAWLILQTLIVRSGNENSAVREAIGRDVKGKASVALYAAGISLSFLLPALGVTMYVAVACLWLIPDRRFEQRLRAASE